MTRSAVNLTAKYLLVAFLIEDGVEVCRCYVWAAMEISCGNIHT